MPARKPKAATPLTVPSDLDVAGAVDAHARLVAAAEKSAASGGETLLDLTDGKVTPLALQLVASAARSFPPDRLRLGTNAAAAMTILETPKRN